MDFDLTEDQKMLRAMVRDFACRELEPIAAEIDEAARFPAESVKKMAALGLMGLGLPEEFGGSGSGTRLILAVEEISRVCAAVGLILSTTAGLAACPIRDYGNEAQKRRYLPPIASGEKLAAFALTETGAGSDPASLETAARRHKNGYLLNGAKVFTTNGNEAEIVVVFATLDRALKHKGITAFILERGTPGFAVGKLERKLGMRASSTAELLFSDCFVPEANRLGPEGDGFKIALNAVNTSRVAIAAQAVGIAQGALDKSLAYARERRQFGQPIIYFQAIQWMLADMATQIDAARLLTYRASHLMDQGLPFVSEASMAKVFASETAMSVTTKAIQVYGGYGYTKDFPVERYFRDAKITEIYEGTSEIQRLTIARRLMKEG